MSRQRRSLTLLQRLYLLVGFALVPAVLLLVGAVAALRAQHAEAARDQARRIAEDGAARLERIIEGTRQTLLMLAESGAIRAGDARACALRLHTLGQRLPERIRFAVLDRDGRVLCDTTDAGPEERGADRPGGGMDLDVRAVLAAGGFVLAGFGPEARGPGDTSRILALRMALPVGGAAEEGAPPAGVVAAALGLPWIATQLRPIGLPPGAELFLLDHDGQPVLRLIAAQGRSDDIAPPPAGTRVAETLASLLAALRADDAGAGQGAAAGAGGPGEAFRRGPRAPDHRALLRDGPGPDGTPRLHALAPEVVGAQGRLYLAVSLDAAGALAAVAEVGWRWALLLLLGLTASLAAAGLGAQRFVLAPLRALQQTAQRWAAGEYGARAGAALAAPPPEFARLAAALDRVAEAAEQRDRAAAALAEKEARLSLALEAGGLGAWEMDPRSGAVERSPQHDALFGYAQPPAEWSYRRLLRHVVPEDRAKVEAAFRRALAEAAPFRAECRIRRAGDGEVRWLEATGAPHRGPDGRVKYLGVVADITERRRAEEHLRLVAGELNHRVKNTLAAVQSIAAQTLRWPPGEVPAAETARAAFEARLLALARSHELLTREGWSGADLAELAARALAPHAGGPQARGADHPRVTIAGPPVRLSPRSAIPIAMALHELATNAARHGALSVPQGRVAVRWTVAPPASARAGAGRKGGGEAPVLTLHWEESGGPPLPGPPARRGFGTRLLERGLAMELRGTVRLDFAREGLRCAITAPLAAAATPDQAPAAPGPDRAPVPPPPAARQPTAPPDRAAMAEGSAGSA